MQMTTRVLALAAIALAAWPAQAGARAPATTETQLHVARVIADCGDFQLLIDGDVSRRATMFFDRDGTPEREVIARRQQSTISNSKTGASVEVWGLWRVTRFYVDGQITGPITQTGRLYLVTVTGLGEIFRQAGRFVVEDGQIVFEGGPHDFEHGNFDELCDYLAG